MNKLTGLFKDEEGASMPEYALLVALIAVVVIFGATALGTAINSKMNGVATKVTNAGS
jgi:pilus assembly protein Flp/PilA